MTTARPLRPASPLHVDRQARRLSAAYLLSLALHGLLLFGVTGGWQMTPPRDSQPVYYVDLVHKPVLNPQAGRPEPRAATPPAPAPAPPAPAVKAPEKVAVPSKAAPATRAPVKESDRQVSDALQKLRDERALQDRLAALRQSQAIPAEIPVGLPDAKGTEAGVSSLVYVQSFIQQNWALSPYLLADAGKMARIEAWVVLSYSKSGKLESFRFERESPDLQFNESVKRALIKSQQLPNTLPQRLEEVRVVFNLKELAEARR
jgi:hypothetical protein